MKRFNLLLLILGVVVITVMAFSVGTTETVSNYDIVLLEQAETPIIYEASLLDFFKDLDWLGIITLLFAGGLITIIAAVRKAIKEMTDVKTKFLLYWEDKVLTEAEKEDLIKELGEAILAVDSVWGVLKGLFKQVRKKE